MYILKNDLLQLTIARTGAEMQRITGIKNNMEFMWDGDLEFWSGHAPHLFPIVGTLKDDMFMFNSEIYHLPRHGFARRHSDYAVNQENDRQITFTLTDSPETLKLYPFHFELKITYTLHENVIKVDYEVVNMDDKTIYFSLGAHPAFNCPVYHDETYADYLLHFDQAEQAKTHTLNPKNGLITTRTLPVFSTPHTINLTPTLFDDDALIFEDLHSKKVSLVSKDHGKILSVNFAGFPYLGLWAKPGAQFVCIEPWHGISDSENTNQELVQKEGIIDLNVKQTFRASYSIEIEHQHLA